MAILADNDSDSVRTCRRCRSVKPISEFHRNRRRVDGLAQHCKACFAEIGERSYRKRKAAAGKTVRDPRVVPAGLRWCPDCAEARPEVLSSRNAADRSGIARYCKAHANERTIASRQRLHGGARHYHLLHRYGVSASDVDLMIERQAGLCPICRRHLGKRHHVDHDHATGLGSGWRRPAAGYPKVVG